MHHVSNEHSFKGDIVINCSHENIGPEDLRKKKWLKKSSNVHNPWNEVKQDNK